MVNFKIRQSKYVEDVAFQNSVLGTKTLKWVGAGVLSTLAFLILWFPDSAKQNIHKIKASAGRMEGSHPCLFLTISQ